MGNVSHHINNISTQHYFVCAALYVRTTYVESFSLEPDGTWILDPLLQYVGEEREGRKGKAVRLIDLILLWLSLKGSPS